MKPRKEISGRIFSNEEYEELVDRLPEHQKQPFNKPYYQQIEAILGARVTKSEKPTSDSVHEVPVILTKFNRRGFFRRLRSFKVS